MIRRTPNASTAGKATAVSSAAANTGRRFGTYYTPQRLSYANAARIVRDDKRIESRPATTKPSTAEAGTQTDVETSTQTGESTDQSLMELKETIVKETGEKIDSTFGQMKACLLEMKTAIETDMDRRDEAISESYITAELFWSETHSIVKTMADIFQQMCGLHTAAMGKRQPPEAYIESWNSCAEHEKELIETLKHLARNKERFKSSSPASSTADKSDAENC